MKSPKLIPDWKRVARYSWAVKLSIVASFLSAAEFALPFIAPEKPSGRFAAAAVLVSLAAGLSRLFAQRKLSGNE